MLNRPLRIVLEAMGGDLGPRPCIEGAVLAAQKFNLEVIIVGNERNIRRFLSRLNIRDPRLKVVHAEEKVVMTDNPRDSLRKKNSSLAIAVDLVKRGEGDAVVSPSNTGAFLAHSMMGWRNIPGIKKPAIATLFPTVGDHVVIVDSGAVVDCKPRQLVNFAIMGATYAREVLGRSNPRIGLLSIGEEDTKGNEVTIETNKLLRSLGINFVGNAEGRDIFTGEFDVIVCDGFVGNILLKTAEGLAKTFTELLKREAKRGISTMVGGALMYPAVKSLKRRIDYDEYGGAPLLGVNGVAIICHGSSNQKAIMNAIRVAAEAVNRDLVKQVHKDLDKYHGQMENQGLMENGGR